MANGFLFHGRATLRVEGHIILSGDFHALDRGINGGLQAHRSGFCSDGRSIGNGDIQLVTVHNCIGCNGISDGSDGDLFVGLQGNIHALVALIEELNAGNSGVAGCNHVAQTIDIVGHGCVGELFRSLNVNVIALQLPIFAALQINGSLDSAGIGCIVAAVGTAQFAVDIGQAIAQLEIAINGVGRIGGGILTARSTNSICGRCSCIRRHNVRKVTIFQRGEV